MEHFQLRFGHVKLFFEQQLLGLSLPLFHLLIHPFFLRVFLHPLSLQLFQVVSLWHHHFFLDLEHLADLVGHLHLELFRFGLGHLASLHLFIPQVFSLLQVIIFLLPFSLHHLLEPCHLSLLHLLVLVHQAMVCQD